MKFNVASVLIADDDPLVRVVLQHAVETSGHSVAAVADGAELLARLADTAYDLCIMDASMPGPDLGERLARARSERPDMQLIVLSGYAIPPCELGRDGVRYLRKPLELGSLRAALAALPGAEARA